MRVSNIFRVSIYFTLNKYLVTRTSSKIKIMISIQVDSPNECIIKCIALLITILCVKKQWHTFWWARLHAVHVLCVFLCAYIYMYIIKQEKKIPPVCVWLKYVRSFTFSCDIIGYCSGRIVLVTFARLYPVIC